MSTGRDPTEPRSSEAPTPAGSAETALGWVEEGMTLGLGTGRAASAFVEALARRVSEGLHVVGVPTSEATRRLAGSLGISLAALEDVGRLDITFDGADEVDDQLDCIKGYGAAMVREKVVAASSEELVILVGPEKLVDRLGQRGRLPIEVLPFAAAFVQRELDRLGLDASLRHDEQASILVTDNGNWILDAKPCPPLDARSLEAAIVALPGVLGTGFFLGMADRVVVGDGNTVDVRTRA